MNRKINQILTLVVVAILAIACGNSTKETVADPVFNITAKIDTLDYKMAYLGKYKEGDFVKLDSIAVDHGVFSFSGMVKFPNVQYIKFDDSRERLSVFVENSDISIVGTNLNPENYTISGSAIQTQLTAFKAQVETYDERLKIIVDEFYAAKDAGDKVSLEKVEAKYEQEDSLRDVFIEEYIYANLTTVISPYLSTKHMMGKGLEELALLNNSFSDSIRDSEYIVAIEQRVMLLKNSAVGQPAPLFAMNDKDGNSIALESFKGTYVLVDFWASWCGPCREENPNVVAAYKKYHDKGFDILGVSFDENKEGWLKAVDADGLTWSHVSDLKGWKNAAGKIYGVKSIPHSVLINKEGVIIAKDLRGEELHTKLEEIFN